MAIEGEGKPPSQVELLRLEPKDVALLWGAVDGFLARQGDKGWPRMRRIKRDLDAMMEKQEEARELRD